MAESNQNRGPKPHWVTSSYNKQTAAAVGGAVKVEFVAWGLQNNLNFHVVFICALKSESFRDCGQFLGAELNVIAVGQKFVEGSAS